MTRFTRARRGPGTAKRGRDATRACNRNRHLGAKVRDALELLAAASPSCPEPLLLAHGIKVETLASLVRDRLATVQQPDTGCANDRTMQVIRIAITDVGRKAITR